MFLRVIVPPALAIAAGLIISHLARGYFATLLDALEIIL